MSTATDTGTATTGPATFSDLPSASWSEDSSASTPSPSTTDAAPASADATVPPASEPTTEGTPQSTGEPPKERWADILANARTKAAEEASAPWKDYEWVRQVPAADFKSAVDRMVAASRDPIAFITDFIGEAANDPTWGPKLRQLALQQAQPQAQPKPGLPDLSQVVVDLGNGQTLSLAELEASLLSKVEQKFGQPLKTVEQIAAERQQLQAQQAADKFAQATIGKLAALPGFDQHKAQIGDYVARNPPRDDQGRFTDDPHALRAAAYEAYLQIVVPTLSSSAQSQLLDDLKHKARASTSVNPGSTAPSTPKSYNSFSELPAEAWS